MTRRGRSSRRYGNDTSKAKLPIAWGESGLDLAVLAAQGAGDQRRYHLIRAELGGDQHDQRLAEVELHWAVVQANAQYLTFAADHLGEHRTRELAATVERALHDLGAALRAER